MIAAILWGMALIHDKSEKVLEVPIIANTSAPALTEVEAAYDSATTLVYSTTRVPLLVIPSLATSRMIVSPTVRAKAIPEEPLRPILVDSSSDSASGDTSVSQSGDCLLSGAWALKEQCKKHCPSWNDYEAHGEVSKRSWWVCVSCPLQS
jgi:hypothetical protein